MYQISNDSQNVHPQSSSFLLSPNSKPKGFQSPDINQKQVYSPFVVKNGSNSNYSTRPFNFLTEKKKIVSNSKLYTPSPNTSKTDKLSDRFIPMNKGINLMEKFNLANRYDERDENCNNSNVDSNFNYSGVKYNEILKQNVLNENSPLPIYGGKNNTAKPIKTKIFSFKSETKPRNNFYQTLLNNQKNNDTPYLDESIRKINPKPYKILQAHNLLDDFYLNLVDWSSKNDIAVGLGNQVGLWCTNQTQESILCSYYNTPDKYVSSVIWSPSGDSLAVGTSKGQVELYDVATHKLLNIFGGHEARVGVVAWNGNLISSGSKDCAIITRDIRCNNLNGNNDVLKYIGHNQEVCGLKWSFDGTQLASGGNDNKLMVWNLHSTKPLMCNCSHTAAVKAIAWSPHQHNLLVSGGGTADRTIRFWNTSTFSLVNKIDTGSQVCNLVFSKTVNELVSTHGFSLNQIIVWKLPTMQKIATLIGHTYRVLYLGLSPDGQNIVTGAGDESLRFWNLFPPFKKDAVSSLFPSNKDIR